MYSAFTRKNVSWFLPFLATTNKKSWFDTTKSWVLLFKHTNTQHWQKGFKLS